MARQNPGIGAKHRAKPLKCPFCTQAQNFIPLLKVQDMEHKQEKDIQPQVISTILYTPGRKNDLINQTHNLHVHTNEASLLGTDYLHSPISLGTPSFGGLATRLINRLYETMRSSWGKTSQLEYVLQGCRLVIKVKKSTSGKAIICHFTP